MVYEDRSRETRRDESTSYVDQANSRLLREFDNMTVPAQDALLREMVRRHAVNVQRQSTTSIVEAFQRNLHEALGLVEEEASGQNKRFGRPSDSRDRVDAVQDQRQAATTPAEHQSARPQRRMRTRPGVFEGGSTWQDVIENIVKDHPGGLHVDEITSEIKENPDMPSTSRDIKAIIQNNLSKMSKTNRVKRLGRGRYAPVGSGSAD